MKIIHQEENEKQGNDCIILNCFLILEVHGRYLAANVRRYIGWCDRGLDVRYLQTYYTETEAREHLEVMKQFDY